MKNNLELIVANPKHTKAILDHLLESLNQFCEVHPEFEKVDVFMGVHNFHVVTVLSLEQQAGDIDTRGQIVFREMALETFRRAMENKPAFKRHKGSY